MSCFYIDIFEINNDLENNIIWKIIQFHKISHSQFEFWKQIMSDRTDILNKIKFIFPKSS
jgi:hypothetical protein